MIIIFAIFLATVFARQEKYIDTKISLSTNTDRQTQTQTINVKPKGDSTNDEEKYNFLVNSVTARLLATENVGVTSVIDVPFNKSGTISITDTTTYENADTSTALYKKVLATTTKKSLEVNTATTENYKEVTENGLPNNHINITTFISDLKPKHIEEVWISPKYDSAAFGKSRKMLHKTRKHKANHGPDRQHHRKKERVRLDPSTEIEDKKEDEYIYMSTSEKTGRNYFIKEQLESDTSDNYKERLFKPHKFKKKVPLYLASSEVRPYLYSQYGGQDEQNVNLRNYLNNKGISRNQKSKEDQNNFAPVYKYPSNLAFYNSKSYFEPKIINRPHETVIIFPQRSNYRLIRTTHRYQHAVTHEKKKATYRYRPPKEMTTPYSQEEQSTEFEYLRTTQRYDDAIKKGKKKTTHHYRPPKEMTDPYPHKQQSFENQHIWTTHRYNDAIKKGKQKATHHYKPPKEMTDPYPHKKQSIENQQIWTTDRYYDAIKKGKKKATHRYRPPKEMTTPKSYEDLSIEIEHLRTTHRYDDAIKKEKKKTTDHYKPPKEMTTLSSYEEQSIEFEDLKTTQRYDVTIKKGKKKTTHHYRPPKEMTTLNSYEEQSIEIEHLKTTHRYDDAIKQGKKKTTLHVRPQRGMTTSNSYEEKSLEIEHLKTTHRYDDIDGYWPPKEMTTPTPYKEQSMKIQHGKTTHRYQDAIEKGKKKATHRYRPPKDMTTPYSLEEETTEIEHVKTTHGYDEAIKKEKKKTTHRYRPPKEMTTPTPYKEHTKEIPLVELEEEEENEEGEEKEKEKVTDKSSSNSCETKETKTSNSCETKETKTSTTPKKHFKRPLVKTSTTPKKHSKRPLVKTSTTPKMHFKPPLIKRPAVIKEPMTQEFYLPDSDEELFPRNSMTINRKKTYLNAIKDILIRNNRRPYVDSRERDNYILSLYADKKKKVKLKKRPNVDFLNKYGLRIGFGNSKDIPTHVFGRKKPKRGKLNKLVHLLKDLNRLQGLKSSDEEIIESSNESITNETLNNNKKKHLNTITEIRYEKNNKYDVINLQKTQNSMQIQSIHKNKALIYLNVLKDLILDDSKALKQYDWLTTTVQIQSVISKTLELIKRIRLSEPINPVDLQILRYIVFLHNLFLENREENKLTNTIKLLTYKKKRKIKLWQEIGSNNRVWQYLRALLPDEVEDDKFSHLYKFLIKVQDGLFDLHKAITHIAGVTKFDRQNWYGNLKQLYLSTDEKHLRELLLHISMSRLVDLVEHSCKHSLDLDFIEFVKTNKKNAKRIVNEMLFIDKILD